jgi:hypothetical protein
MSRCQFSRLPTVGSRLDEGEWTKVRARCPRQSSLGVTRVMAIDPLGQKSFAAALPAPRKRGAPAFRAHSRTEAVLTFASSLGWLIGPFHKAEK